MGRRSDHSREELRSMALSAAGDIIKDKGFQKLTTRSVAKKIGYTVGTLYHIFHNLDDLITALNTQTVGKMRREIERLAAEVPDPATRLRTMAHAYVAFAFADPNLWRLAFEHQFPGDESIPKELAREIDALFANLAAALDEYQPGRSREEVAIAAAALWSGVHGVCHLALTNKLDLSGMQSIKPVLDQLVDAYLAGLVAMAIKE